jgi:membrane-associated protease RseP (regulator of RpoE activity)
MFWNRNWIRCISTGLALAIAMHNRAAQCQSPVPGTQTQPEAPASAANNGTLALPVIDEAQRVRPGDARLLSANLFAQDRDSFDQVNEAQQAIQPIVPPVPGTPQPVAPPVPALSAADANLLRQAGIVLGTPITGRLIVERVMPNSAAFVAGVRPGDVITRIDRTPVAVSNPLRPAVVSGGATIGLDVERRGHVGRMVLNMTAPVVMRPAEAPPVRTAAAPVVPSAIAPVTTPSGRVVESIPAAPAPFDHATTARTRVLAPGSGSTTGSGVGGTGDAPQGPGTPGLGSAPSEGGGSAAMRTGRNAPVKPGQAYGTGRLY